MGGWAVRVEAWEGEVWKAEWVVRAAHGSWVDRGGVSKPCHPPTPFRAGHRGGEGCLWSPQAPFYFEEVSDLSLRAVAAHCSGLRRALALRPCSALQHSCASHHSAELDVAPAAACHSACLLLGHLQMPARLPPASP